MEAQQCVKLSLTNRSIGLIPHYNSPKKSTFRAAVKPLLAKDQPLAEETPHDKAHFTPNSWTPNSWTLFSGLGWLGGHSGGETPDPIPNSDVKPSSANGTAS